MSPCFLPCVLYISHTRVTGSLQFACMQCPIQVMTVVYMEKNLQFQISCPKIVLGGTIWPVGKPINAPVVCKLTSDCSVVKSPSLTEMTESDCNAILN